MYTGVTHITAVSENQITECILTSKYC